MKRKRCIVGVSISIEKKHKGVDIMPVLNLQREIEIQVGHVGAMIRIEGKRDE